jgi:peptidoglycan hydrolase-like protein with peptidoglycan-binding domain
MRNFFLATATALPLITIGAFPALSQQRNATGPADQTHQGDQINAPQASSPVLNLSQSDIRRMQEALDEKGYAAGRADGIMGPRTEAALRSFQQSKGLQATGQPSQQTVAALGINPASGQPNNAGSGEARSSTVGRGQQSSQAPASAPQESSRTSANPSPTTGQADQGNMQPKPVNQDNHK